MATAPHHPDARRALRGAALALAVAGALFHSAAPAPAYGWPVAPLDRRHPVRGFLGEPRVLGEARSLHRDHGRERTVVSR
jgi:hypothetical protein